VPHHWDPCIAIMLVEGRGPVQCWVPPKPGRSLCPAHDPVSKASAGDAELRARITALLREIHPKAKLCEFYAVPGESHYELRVGMPNLVGKWVVLPKSIVQRAAIDLTAHRALRNCLTTIVLVQQAHRAVDQSREVLADSVQARDLASRRFLPMLDSAALSRDLLAGVSPKWILVADDDDAIREVWTEMLTLAGYRALTARNGLEALELMRAVVPDLIMLDLRMPEMDGPSFLKVLDGAPLLREIPVLIVSGFLDGRPPGASLGLNIVGSLPKPVRQADLLEAVRTALLNTESR
jgi:CheY-like chemotaxis protein